MATVDEAAAMALALPEVTEGTRHGYRTWLVREKGFVWERPFTKADVRRFGDVTPPDGPILATHVEDLADKEAVLAANPKGFFTMAHFDGYPAVLIQLRVVGMRALRAAVVDAWLSCAPEPLVEAYLREERARRRRRPTSP